MLHPRMIVPPERTDDAVRTWRRRSARPTSPWSRAPHALRAADPVLCDAGDNVPAMPASTAKTNENASGRWMKAVFGRPAH
ncbi:hypothetical protein V1460_32835 [Streptomyces sp. SCSIO 30461]|uniref:hypothetical protein n=1 Tax=Streptomyces sp. SCSIO 30461 TaxID=3118085 RepID=UPI0030CD7108